MVDGIVALMFKGQNFSFSDNELRLSITVMHYLNPTIERLCGFHIIMLLRISFYQKLNIAASCQLPLASPHHYLRYVAACNIPIDTRDLHGK